MNRLGSSLPRDGFLVTLSPFLSGRTKKKSPHRRLFHPLWTPSRTRYSRVAPWFLRTLSRVPRVVSCLSVNFCSIHISTACIGYLAVTPLYHSTIITPDSSPKTY